MSRAAAGGQVADFLLPFHLSRYETLLDTQGSLTPMADKKSSVALPIDELVQEAIRIKVQIQKLTNELNNPELELAVSVRVSVQKRELEAYLRGILYALGEGEPLP